MRRSRNTMLIIFVIIFTASCSTYLSVPTLTPTPTSTPTPTPINLTEQVQIEHSKWYKLGPKNYHIVIKFYESWAVGLETQRDITVKDGDVVNSSCLSNQCPAFDFVDTYTVNDLFLIAEGSIIRRIGEEYNSCVKSLEFDKTYGFPKVMKVDCPRTADEEYSFEVISFEALK